MKTLKDILLLIADQEEKNKNKMLKYKFELNTRYNWLSLYQIASKEGDIYGEEIRDIFNSLSIATPEAIQQAYWTAYNNTRKE